jgi:heat shock protein HslJ
VFKICGACTELSRNNTQLTASSVAVTSKMCDPHVPSWWYMFIVKLTVGLFIGVSVDVLVERFF